MSSGSDGSVSGTSDTLIAPSECHLCRFKYGSKFAIQDHLFSRKHLHALKRSIDGYQSDHQKKENETRATMVASNWLRPASVSNITTEKTTISSRKDAPHSSSSFGETASTKQQTASGSSQPALSGNSNIMSPFNFGNLSGSSTSASADASSAAVAATAAASLGLLPFMYPTVAPGAMGSFMPAALGMPMMTAGFLPDPESMFLYDPLMFGSPLTLLQIPAQAIAEIQRQLQDTSSTLARYTHDCKKSAEIKASVSSADQNCIRETTLDVGFICRKCHMVYPMKEACASHQQVTCYRGDKSATDQRHMVKLEQILYECTPCQSRLSTQQDVKNHCSQPQHKQRL